MHSEQCALYIDVEQTVKMFFGDFTKGNKFANAGVGEFVSFGKVSEEHFDKLFNINVKGALFTVQKGSPLMNDGAAIIQKR